MKLLLVFPPTWQFSQPYLSIPSLTAFMKANNYDVRQLDLNLTFHNTVLDFDYLTGLMRQKGLRRQFLPDELNKYLNVISKLDIAKKIMRSEPYYNNEEFFRAKYVFEIAYGLYSAVYAPTEINSQSFLTRYNNNATHGVRRAIEDRHENPFIDFYQTFVLPDLLVNPPDILGISMVIKAQMVPAMTLARLVKHYLPNTHVVMGGSLISKTYESFVKAPYYFRNVFDSIVIGEGERPLLELTRALESGDSLEGVANLVYKKHGKVIVNQRKEPIPVNELPPPDFDDIPLQHYLAPEIALPVLWSRGCYWRHCSFCDHYHVYGDRYQKRVIDKIIGDLKYLKERYQINSFSVEDEAVTAKLANTVAQAILAADLDINWRIQARLEKQYTDEVFANLNKSGCKMLFFGLESANSRMLKMIEKGIKIPEVEKIYQAAHRNKVFTYTYIIIGFPSETRAEIQETIDFIRNNKDILHGVGLSIFALMKEAPMAANPEKFHISKIIQAEKDDLALHYEFESESDIQRAELSEEFVNILNKFWEIYQNPMWLILHKDVSIYLYLLHYGFEKFCALKAPKEFFNPDQTAFASFAGMKSLNYLKENLSNVQPGLNPIHQTGAGGINEMLSKVTIN